MKTLNGDRKLTIVNLTSTAEVSSDHLFVYLKKYFVCVERFLFFCLCFIFF